MPNDLISRSALLAYVKELPTWEATDRGFFAKRYPCGFFAPDDVVKSILYAPTIDPESLRPTGRKERSAISKTGLMCTNCYSDIDLDAVFCKYCGAKMMEE